MSKIIQLTKGFTTVVDDDMWEYLMAWRWHARISSSGNKVYASRYGRPPEKKTVQMHRVITSCPPGLDVDHINGDGLNNRTSNLRVCTRSQNSRNLLGPTRRNKSGYMGVSYNPDHRKYIAHIYVNGRNIRLGDFDDPAEAHIVYMKARRHHYGEFSGGHEGVLLAGGTSTNAPLPKGESHGK